mmetsp:Transcript_17429/g.29217  ORF Transcript_17429/g.29217 Transcript_17429/m.29217 type:complete len:602 (+) Transcript_17429:157-1962(+)|eukprot:CAMPEP_0114427354 /NCGR_PEP_ID=MMETSP0103-20121206/8299_1 /TAXON_ID=37642 ORGANISM="Paraphysomonas imperforata, Strain PA2" /NCGR_SAMPLE_ID=MMETSP0103 /ASSEMBLY_ACC=CAM_ASM_000201 /LENGTH=601 /DNA_ID=CAMNT_0001596401 /DNA_START=136 /DNA_END=1941 /DNA_ORIENTATION=+
MSRNQTQVKIKGGRRRDKEVPPEGDHHYEDVMNLLPSRKIKRKSSMHNESYSDTDSDESVEAQTEQEKRKERRKNAEKLFNQYKKFKNFNIPEVYQAMGVSAQNSDKRYILANSSDWRFMWGKALNIVGKKKYTGLVESVSSIKISDVSRNKEDEMDHETLPPLVPQSRREKLTDSPLLNQKQRSLSADHAVNDYSEDDEISIASSVDSTASNKIMRERSRLRKMKSMELKAQENIERKELMERLTSGPDHAVLSMPPPSYSQSSLLSRKYGATSNKYHDETVALRRIGKALEGFSRQERRDLIERGNVELLELTNMRTRIQMFLNISISAHEAEALFKKFDPNKMGSVNIADIYGNAMSSVKRKKPKMGGSMTLSAKSTRSRKSSRDSTNSDWGSTDTYGGTSRGGGYDQTRDIVVSTALDEKVDSVGQLDGNIRCTVLMNRKRPQQETSNDHGDAEEVAEDNSVDLSKTMRADVHDNSGEIEEDEHAFDEFIETLTPDLGMSSTMNVREFNTLEESDSVSNIVLCSIDEDIQEEDEEEEQDIKESFEGLTPVKHDIGEGEHVVGAGDTGEVSVTEGNYNDDSFEECTSTGGLDDQVAVT